MGKVTFRGYLISRFFPTREIRENFMHAKICVLQYITVNMLAVICICKLFLNVATQHSSDITVSSGLFC